MTTPDLQAFYAELDKSIPPECIVWYEWEDQRRPVIISGLAYSRASLPAPTREEWLAGLESRIAEALRG